jgi:hypothetical protein
VYALLHHAAQELFAASAIEAMRRHLGVGGSSTRRTDPH